MTAKLKLEKNTQEAAVVDQTTTAQEDGVVVVEETTTKAKVTKKKPVATAEAQDTQVVNEDVDMIEKVANEVENLQEAKAMKMVPALLDGIDHDYFKLGGVLAVIQVHGWFMNSGHETFRAYVENECGIAYRKAMYLIQIYNGLVASGVKWSQVKHLGWTKLKELSSILTPENVEEWVAIAEGMTVIQLQEYIKQAAAASSQKADDHPDDSTQTKVTTKTFKLHEDQKETVNEALAKCKNEMGTDADSVALEHICLDYLAGDAPMKKLPTLVELMKGKSMEEVLEAFSEIFPEANVTVEIPE